jgi:peptidoglycan/LPS O-acetylase OafA/YrhL
MPHVLLLVVLLAHLTYRYVEEPARQAMRGSRPGARRSRPGARRSLGDPDATVVFPAVEASAVPLPRHRAQKVGA